MAPLRENELPAVNKIFVDREIPLKVFEDAAFVIPADRSTVCVFYGVGGQGKTALRRELFRKIDPAVEPSYGFLGCAELDLHDRSKTDPDLLLVWIRNSFVKAGVDLPAFDLALAITWEATRPEQSFPKLTKPWLGRITEGANMGLDEGAGATVDWLKSEAAIDLLGDIVGEIPGLGVLFKKGGRWAIDKAKKTYLSRTRKALKELYSNGKLKKPYELSKLLPWMLAQDLNFYIAEHPEERLVLLIDEYERVFDEGGAGVRWKENPIDANIRTLIQYSNGLLAVFFSREQLPWKDDPDWRDDLKNAQHSLSGLADKDANDFLLAIPVVDEVIRQAIIDGARETSQAAALVYPLLLDLLVEHWRLLSASGAIGPEDFEVTAASFEGRRREIVARILRDYGLPLQTTLERLSVARRFDRSAFAYVIETFGTALPLDQFERLSELSFITKSDDGFLTIHNAIAETIRETLMPEKRRTSIEALFEHFEARAKVSSPLEVTDASIAALIEASFLRWAQGAEGYVGWLEKLNGFVKDAARFSSVTALWREAVSTVEVCLGSEHPDTARSLNNLGFLLTVQGNLAGARPLYERALAIREKTLGPEHPQTAQSINNLAGLLKLQGDFAGARPLYERALAIWEKTLGPEHPETATGLNNLARLLEDEGDLAGARPFYERALAIREKALGPEHPHTAQSFNNLAVLLKNQGDLAGARPLYERALAIREKSLGPEHPETATSLHDFGVLVEAQGDLAGARPLYERALAIWEKTLGPEHPETATGLNNFGVLLKAQGDFAGARPLYERALAIWEKTLGREHPETATGLKNLAHLLEAEGDLAGARPFYERALAIREKTLGREHPQTATVRRKLEDLDDR